MSKDNRQGMDAAVTKQAIGTPALCAGLGVHAPGLNDSMSAKAIDQRHESWSQRLPDAPDDLWEKLIAFDGDEQAALFAHCAAFGINAVREPANRYNESRVSAHTVAGRIAHSHVLARAANKTTRDEMTLLRQREG